MGVEMKKGHYVLCYTREPQEELIYAPKLAYSMHLAYSEDGQSYEALNHNSGVLFVKATENSDGSLNAKSLKNPYLFHMADDTFGVVAIRTEADGTYDAESKGSVVFFTSTDLLQYEEVGLVDLNKETYVKDVTCDYHKDKGVYVIAWQDEEGHYYESETKDLKGLSGMSVPREREAFTLPSVVSEIEGIVPRNDIGVSEQVAKRLYQKLTVPQNTAVQVPDCIKVTTPEDLKSVKAVALYSDGTTAIKPVDWKTETIDWEKPGNYVIEGTVHQDHYVFPVALNRADPCIAKWQDKYYFIATNDADGNHTLYMRAADTIAELVEAEEVLILDSDTYEDIRGLLWAPEFHIINDELYIFHAATTGEFFYEESHVMKLRQGGNPMCKEDWSRPRKVVKKDGSDLCEAGKTISLDMTVFKQNGEYYVVWSQRQFLPVDLGAWLYIAKIDANEPWRLTTDPVILSKPEYGWANNHTFVDEGPFALVTDQKLFLTFSSALVDATYAVGLLSADLEADVLDPKSWTKGNYPLLTSRSVEGEYGTGHNAYVIDEDGNVWNTYHARPGIDGPRSSGIRRVHFDNEGYPVLDLTEDKDLNEALKKVTMEIIVC